MQAFSDPYFPVYGQNRIRIFPYLVRIGNSVQIQENTVMILETYGKIRSRESLANLVCFNTKSKNQERFKNN